jgi:hypothetical protein
MRTRALPVVMVLVGLLFLAGIYPIADDLWHGDPADTGDDMMMALYVTLGVFLLLAVRNPAAHRSLIAFAAWSSFAHAVVMSALAFVPKEAGNRAGFLGGSAGLAVIGIALLALAPARAKAAAPAPSQ